MKNNIDFFNTVLNKADLGKTALSRRRKKITSFAAGLLALAVTFSSIYSIYLAVSKNSISVDSIDIASLSISKNLMEGLEIDPVTDSINLSGRKLTRATDKTTKFAFDLFKASYKGDNTLLSPYSVYTALAMTANGADGQTKKEIEKALGLSVGDMNEFLSYCQNEYKKDVRGKLDNRNVVTVANSVWFRNDLDGFKVRKSFLKDLNHYYEAEAYAAPFDDGTVSEINAWVDENTEGVIKNMLGGIPDSTTMFIINTVLFNASWNMPFDDDTVKPKVFTSADGTEKTVDFLHRGKSSLITLDNAYGFLEHYRGEYSFVALLPHEGSSTDEVIDSLDSKSFLPALENRENDGATIAFPVFKQEYSSGLDEICQELGIERIFDEENADFSNLASVSGGNNIHVDDIIHKTYIELSPLGTVAGAATNVTLRLTGIEDPKPTVNLVFDRPFVYLILDKNNVPLFIGVLENME